MAAEAGTTRVFVRGLPPTLTEQDLRSHFACRYPVTDAKLLTHRRIGYVGFKTAEDAEAATRYFNKSFMRLSKIRVELAKTLRKSSKLRPMDNTPEQERPKKSTLKRKFLEESDDMNRNSMRIQHSRSPSPSHNSEVGRPTSSEEAVNLRDSRASPNPPDGLLVDEKQGQGDSNAYPKVTLASVSATSVPDQDWIRLRTSRLLGLADEGEEERDEMTTEGEGKVAADAIYDNTPADIANGKSTTAAVSNDSRLHVEVTRQPDAKMGTVVPQYVRNANEKHDVESIEIIRRSGRLFLRNLSYSTTEEDIAQFCGSFGDINEVHIPVNSTLRVSKGFAFVQYANPEDAISAFLTLDGTVFQGRLLHILPSAGRRGSQLDGVSMAQPPHKRLHQASRKNEASAASFRWNSMYMNADAVVSSISDRLGIPKSAILDPSASDSAVKQAQAETHAIQEAKAYFEAHGLNFQAFTTRDRSDTAILVKNFPFGTKPDELRKLFSHHGDISKLLMPPSGTIAVVEFKEKAQARTAFRALAYRKLKDSALFLEMAPKYALEEGAIPKKEAEEGRLPQRLSSNAMDESDYSAPDTTTLFVRNLNFTTTNERFRETFAPLNGLLSARIKTKVDPNRPGQRLSMGFGFLEFGTSAQARSALAAMNGFSLDNHRLLIRESHKTVDAAAEKGSSNLEQRKPAKQAKIVIKNLPFEVSKKDIRSLFKAYGQLRTVRVPKKFDNSRKGYAFAEFTSAKEAESAMSALRDTHLLGRRLVLEYATGGADDAESEITKMQQKIGKQSNSVALQKLAIASERRKFIAVANENGE